MRRWLDDILCLTFMYNLPGLDFSVSCENPQPYLPPKEGTSDINFEDMVDISQRSSQLEFLKHAVHLVGNKFDTRHIGPVIVELAQDAHNRALLQTLLDQKLLMAEAFMEELLFDAVRGKNIPLIEVILRAGCDINLTRFEHSDCSPNTRGQTILQCAMELQDQELVSVLMTHGADGNARNVHVKPKGSSKYHYYDSLLYVTLTS
jgi:hypothetical protein